MKSLTLALLLILALLAPFAAAQTSLGDDEVLTIEEMPLFDTETTVVTVPVTVLDGKKEYVTGLQKGDFRVFDNDIEQKIDSFDVSFLPISMVICVQSSERVRGIMADVRKTAVLFTGLVLGEFGEAAILSFDSRVKRLQDFTSDHEKIDKALSKITIGSNAVRTSDAAYEAIRMLTRRPPEHRKVIVIISESQNNGSEINMGETMRTAQLNDVMIYSIRLSTLSARLRNMPDPPPSPFPPGISPMPAVPGSVNTPTTMQQANFQMTPNLIPLVIDAIRGVKNLIFSNPLEAMAKATGAVDYSPRTTSGLHESISAIGADLRSQYLLSYTPSDLNVGGIFHHLRVEVPYKGARVRARPGYFHGPRPVVEGDPVRDVDAAR